MFYLMHQHRLEIPLNCYANSYLDVSGHRCFYSFLSRLGYDKKVVVLESWIELPNTQVSVQYATHERTTDILMGRNIPVRSGLRQTPPQRCRANYLGTINEVRSTEYLGQDRGFSTYCKAAFGEGPRTPQPSLSATAPNVSERHHLWGKSRDACLTASSLPSELGKYLRFQCNFAPNSMDKVTSLYPDSPFHNYIVSRGYGE